MVMSRFDDLFDEFVYMAKNAADAASKKTGEVAKVGKLRYQMKQTQWEIEKAYAKLGAIVYESKRSTENFDEMVRLAISEIDELFRKLDELADQVRSYKKVIRCEACGRENENGALFCSRCGEALAHETAPFTIDDEDITEPEEADKAADDTPDEE